MVSKPGLTDRVVPTTYYDVSANPRASFRFFDTGPGLGSVSPPLTRHEARLKDAVCVRPALQRRARVGAALR